MRIVPRCDFLPFVFMQAWTAPFVAAGLFAADASGAITRPRTRTARTEARGATHLVFITRPFGRPDGNEG